MREVYNKKQYKNNLENKIHFLPLYLPKNRRNKYKK